MEINPDSINKRLASYLRGKNCNVNVVKQMILSGADVHYKDSSSNTLIHIALQNSCVDKLNLIHELVVAGAPLNACNFLEKSLLHFVTIYCHDVEVLQKLITHGANVNAKDCDKNTPLHIAAQRNKKSMVEALIDAEAEVNARNVRGETPLLVAVKNGHLEIVKVLLSSKASVLLDDRTNSSPLHVAVRNDVLNQSILIELMMCGANMYHTDAYFNFPLEYAVQRFYENPSDNLLSAKTLIKCSILKPDEMEESDMHPLFDFLNKYDIYPVLETLAKDCMREVQKMKSELIHKNFSLLDFMQEGFECSPIFKKKTIYKELIFNQILHVSRNYSTYTDILAYHLGKTNLCLKSMELCVYTWKESAEGKQRISLSPDAIFIIAGFLSYEDVLNFITAFSDPQHFATRDFGFRNSEVGKSTKRKLDS